MKPEDYGIGTREIKFRIWQEGLGMGFPDPQHQVLPEGAMWCIRTQPGATAMQYTGLKDKNGKEIYEGDIVSMSIGRDCHNDEYVVSFLDGAFGFRVPFCGNEFRSFCFQFPENIQVIGNIFETPELLNS